MKRSRVWLVLSPFLHFSYLHLFNNEQTDEQRERRQILFCTDSSLVFFSFAFEAICVSMFFGALVFFLRMYHVFFWFISSILTRLIKTIVMWCSHARNIIIYITHNFGIICMHWTLRAVTDWLTGWLIVRATFARQHYNCLKRYSGFSFYLFIKYHFSHSEALLSDEFRNE